MLLHSNSRAINTSNFVPCVILFMRRECCVAMPRCVWATAYGTMPTCCVQCVGKAETRLSGTSGSSYRASMRVEST
jgi:hypothetical protein